MVSLAQVFMLTLNNNDVEGWQHPHNQKRVTLTFTLNVLIGHHFP